MTLIAVKELFGTPVLVGDVLVSRPPLYPTKLSFPTQPPNKPLDSEKTLKNLLPSITYRKIYIVSDNLVVGFAGDKDKAASLLRRLYAEFGKKVVTFDEWRRFITGRQPEMRRFVLIGWIVENERKSAFRWDSTNPLHLQAGNEFFEGSGADFARRTFREPDSYTTPTSDDRQKAILCALDGISMLIAFELLDGSNLEAFFGLCYELIVFDGKRFLYVDDVNYMHYKYEWRADRPEKLQGGVVRFCVHYKNYDDHAFCSISNHAYEPHKDVFFVVKPIFGKKAKPNWAPMRTQLRPFDAQYFCNFVYIDASDGKNMRRGFVVEKGSLYLPFEYQDEGNETYIKMKENHTYILQQYLDYRSELP